MSDGAGSWGGPQAKVRAGPREMDESAAPSSPAGSSANGGGGAAGSDLIDTAALQSSNCCHSHLTGDSPEAQRIKKHSVPTALKLQFQILNLSLWDHS